MCAQLVQTVQYAITIAAVNAGIGMHNISSLALAVSENCVLQEVIHHIHGTEQIAGPPLMST